MKFFFKTLILIIISELLILNTSLSAKSPKNFDDWLISFEALALEKGISADTIKIVFKNVKFLDQVIKYDRKQPEFFEDTITYISKRATISKANKAKKLLEKKLKKQI